ncbi:hypothetical protein [Fibrella forsythiae]|uniref:HTH merR-type domain-containing protein n=1 Tax=Fibrella forsythiae TaxID=2817061 RepID=A0ABS3JM00_9BACT|nr:hypothetical protein [Fibrella forsythiae]MBO0951036.1 hypothetical protein [Fibrella forsythiae]
MINDMLLASNKAKGQRPYFFTDPMVERVLNITMAVAGELAVARERVDTLERLLESKGILTRAEIETFQPTTDQSTDRQRWHAEYIARILRIVQQEIEAIQQPADMNRSIDDVADELNREE